MSLHYLSAFGPMLSTLVVTAIPPRSDPADHPVFRIEPLIGRGPSEAL